MRYKKTDRCTPLAAVGIICLSALLFATLGALIGFILGNFFPEYYRSIFPRGGAPNFDPIAVGVGQGLTQGVSTGTVIGLIIAGISLLRSPSPPKN